MGRMTLSIFLLQEAKSNEEAKRGQIRSIETKNLLRFDSPNESTLLVGHKDSLLSEDIEDLSVPTEQQRGEKIRKPRRSQQRENEKPTREGSKRKGRREEGVFSSFRREAFGSLSSSDSLKLISIGMLDVSTLDLGLDLCGHRRVVLC